MALVFCFLRSLKSSKLQFFMVSNSLSSGCNTAVEHTSPNREVVGLIPARCWVLLLLLSTVGFLEEVQHYCISYKNGCLAVQLWAKQA